MNRSIARVAAVAGAVALVLAACSSGESGEGSSESTSGGETGSSEASGDPLKIGTLLPVTGSLAQLGPPEIAGVDLAVEEINGAGGIFGSDVEVTHTDSSDTENAAVATESSQGLISGGMHAIIGAASSGVTFNVIDDITGAGIVQISPANTATNLSGYSDFYFRTAPPDTVQGSALGQLIVGDGKQSVAFLVFNDAYGTGLRDVIEKTVEDAGGTVTYGGKGKGQEFPPGQTTFSSEVTAALAAKPDAIVVLAFDETKSIIPELKSQNADMSKIYMSDGNTADYSKDFDPGTLEGAQGTIPGASPKDELKQRLSDFYKQSSGKELADYSYAAESYDATTLAALAAVKGKGTDSGTIQANMAAVSGADGGTKCETFKACKDLLDKGEDIQYTGPSGIGPFDSKNDPSSAYIGIYKFDGDNKPVYQTAIQGSVSK
jgi:branched-chain amino acid transport system substrate-binding protein